MNLIIKSLNFSYQNEEVFKDLNFNFNSGVLNLISGPSGSGKTSLLNLIAGLEKPSSGSIILNDVIQSDNDKFVEPENRNVGFVFQDFALFPHLNVKQNINFPINTSNYKNRPNTRYVKKANRIHSDTILKNPNFIPGYDKILYNI